MTDESEIHPRSPDLHLRRAADHRPDQGGPARRLRGRHRRGPAPAHRRLRRRRPRPSTSPARPAATSSRPSPTIDAPVRRLLQIERRKKLSGQALEVLSAIAYHQPVTQAEIAAIRSVDSSHALHTLLENKLIKIAGRKEAPGRPLLYRTTDKFLAYFGLERDRRAAVGRRAEEAAARKATREATARPLPRRRLLAAAAGRILRLSPPPPTGTRPYDYRGPQRPGRRRPSPGRRGRAATCSRPAATPWTRPSPRPSP